VDCAALDGRQPHNGFEQRRLAAAVRAEDGGKLPGRQRQRDTVQNREFAVAGSQVSDRKHRR